MPWTGGIILSNQQKKSGHEVDLPVLCTKTKLNPSRKYSEFHVCRGSSYRAQRLEAPGILLVDEPLEGPAEALDGPRKALGVRLGGGGIHLPEARRGVALDVRLQRPLVPSATQP